METQSLQTGPVSSLPVSEEILREKHVPGAVIRERRFGWDSQVRMSSSYSELEVHLRLRPRNLAVRFVTSSPADCRLGRLTLIPPMRFISHPTPAREEVETISCQFDRSWLKELTGMDFDWNQASIPALFDFHNTDVEHAMRRMANELASPGPGTEAMNAALCASIAVDLVRHLTRPSDRVLSCTLSPRQMGRIRELLSESAERFPSAIELATHLGLSLSQLRRAFGAATGQSLHSHLEDVRMTKACDLLARTDLPLKVIAYRVGYKQHSAFSFAFRRKTGLSPLEFRSARPC